MNRVLVVDDEPTIRELIGDALRESGYRVDTAPDGVAALDQVQMHAPNAIVLDLMMPRLNANGFVERLRLNPRYALIPVLIVTASYGAFEAAARLGAHACLPKPFELDELVHMVGQLIDEADSSPAAKLAGAPATQRSMPAQA